MILITLMIFQDHSMNQSDSIQRSDEPLDYADNIQRSDEPKYDISNSIQRSFNRYEIESDFDEEEYWHSVEQERLKEDYKNIYENLKKEYGANIPNEDHGLIINTTLSIIKDLEQETERDDESFKKMICNIYPEVCELYCILDSLY